MFQKIQQFGEKIRRTSINELMTNNNDVGQSSPSSKNSSNNNNGGKSNKNNDKSTKKASSPLFNMKKTGSNNSKQSIMEKVQKLNSIHTEDIDIDDQLDIDFKPGVYRQTKSFLTEDANPALLNIHEHYDNVTACYQKIITPLNKR